MLKALFFDLDGTLINSMDVHVSSWKEAFKLINLYPTRDRLLKLGGYSFKETIRLIAKENGIIVSGQKINEVHNLKRKVFLKILDQIKPYDVYDDLKFLKDKQVKLILVTSTIKKFAQQHCDLFFPNIFDYIFSAEDFSYTKPHPEPYLKSLEYSGFESNECYVIEDAPAGVASGNSAGIKTLAVTTSNTKENLSAAFRVFDSHKDLFNFLEEEL